MQEGGGRAVHFKIKKENKQMQPKNALFLLEHFFQRMWSVKPCLKSDHLEGKVRWYQGLEEYSHHCCPVPPGQHNVNVISTLIKRFLLEMLLSIRSGVVKGQCVFFRELIHIWDRNAKPVKEEGSYSSWGEGYWGWWHHCVHSAEIRMQSPSMTLQSIYF